MEYVFIKLELLQGDETGAVEFAQANLFEL